VALIHIFRVFLFFATLSVASLGLQTFIQQTSPKETLGAGMLNDEFFRPYDWLAGDRAASQSTPVPTAIALVVFAAAMIWMAAPLSVVRRPARIWNTPQNAPRPPPR
jgi:hypothetical protein